LHWGTRKEKKNSSLTMFKGLGLCGELARRKGFTRRQKPYYTRARGEREDWIGRKPPGGREGEMAEL